MRDLHRHFRLEKHRIDVLQGASFLVAEGEWVALVGRSGCGKTTLLHLLGGLDRPSSGEIVCRGLAYSRLDAQARAALRRRHFGFVFQSYHLFPELSAHENVMLPALQWRRDRQAARQRAAELLAGFGLAQRLRHRPQELSGGEQQRVALARALMNEPDVILADEPTGNLDVTAAREIIAILQGLHRERRKTIVMVTHDLRLAALADRILVIREGRAHPVPPGSTPDLGPPPLHHGASYSQPDIR
ncbi:MAG: ABC transporter ATP-binding protein [Lentisphaeria bacterium]|nr:ABC transporter ATP-binding protein [Lentisphaeria bacterium]